MDTKIIDLNGKEKDTIELAEHIFNIEPNNGVIYDAIVNELANKRQGTSSTKGRSEVSGSTKKPYRQKGTGRARAGSRKSPVWKGGGIVFGPKPRDYSYKLPKKIKRLSIRSILSKRLQEERVRVVEDLPIENGKTKEVYDILNQISLVKEDVGELKNNKQRKAVRNYRLTIITEDDKKLLKLGCRNLPWVKCLSFDKLNSYDLFYSKEIMIEKSVLPKLQEHYDKK